MINLRDVTVEFPSGARDRAAVLRSVTLDIHSGNWVALLGANGSGKTTLLHTIAGLVTPASGTVERVSQKERRGDVALLLQEPDNQLVANSVRDELELSVGETSRGVDDALEKFGLMPVVDRHPRRLSGGEKQRLALATVWLQDPRLLLLDEPTAYLDDEAAELCREFVADAHNAGVTVVWATPGGDELLFAQKIVYLDAGRMVFNGALDEWYAWAKASGTEFLRPRVRELAEKTAGVLTEPENAERIADAAGSDIKTLAGELAGMIEGERAPAKRIDPPVVSRRSTDKPVVRFLSAGFAYDGVRAVKDLDLVIGEGECLGLAGRNGAGKSTVLGLAAGVFMPEEGAVERRYERIRDGGQQNVFYLFQSPERLFFAETVNEELSFGLERFGLSASVRERRVLSALEAVGLAPGRFLRRAPLSLSPGEMRRLAFAIALSLEPRLLLLDEPTSCLDRGGRAVLESMLSNRREDGKTSVIASHDTAFLAGVCDRIVWLDEGGCSVTLDTSGGELAPGAVWPAGKLPVLELQEHLAKLGVDIVPRKLTVAGLVERLG